MTDLIDKYDRLSQGFSAREYKDPGAYYRRRARAVIENGPRLSPGETLVDLGCGDGLAAVPLVDYGVAYRGVDASPEMIRVARQHLGDQVSLEVGEIERYTPPEPVAAVTCFRAVYYATDLRRFFAHVRSYTTKKFQFDFALRDFPRSRVVNDLYAAGFSRVELRPFLYPQHYAPGPRTDAVLRGLEQTGPLVYPLLKLRFTYIVSAVP